MMDRHLVPVADDRATDEARLQRRIETLRADVASVAAVLEDLRTTLAAFEARYDARIGVRIVELDAIELEIVRYRRRIEAARLTDHARRAAEQEIERDLTPERQRIDAESQDAERARHRAARIPPEPAPAVKRSLLAQYRKLARQFHPDIATTDDEREYNEHAMRRINAAMERNDLTALERLEAQLPTRTLEAQGSTEFERVRWLQDEVNRLEAVRAHTEAECATLRVTSTWRLWCRVEHDPSLLDRLEADLMRDITTARMELHALQREYEQTVTLRLTPEEAPT
jgi:hypothetical protein